MDQPVPVVSIQDVERVPNLKSEISEEDLGAADLAAPSILLDTLPASHYDPEGMA